MEGVAELELDGTGERKGIVVLKGESPTEQPYVYASFQYLCRVLTVFGEDVLLRLQAAILFALLLQKYLKPQLLKRIPYGALEPHVADDVYTRLLVYPRPVLVHGVPVRVGP